MAKIYKDCPHQRLEFNSYDKIEVNIFAQNNMLYTHAFYTSFHSKLIWLLLAIFITRSISEHFRRKCFSLYFFSMSKIPFGAVNSSNIATVVFFLSGFSWHLSQNGCKSIETNLFFCSFTRCLDKRFRLAIL